MKNFKSRFFKNTPLLLVISFVMVILIGAILLDLPIASKDGNPVGFVNALFTASSATAVTGLTVVNTALHWTVFGKVVIIFLIQIGGLGTMTIFSMALLLLGKRISLKHRLLIKEQFSINSLSGIIKFIIYIIKITFIIELTGAFLLSLYFIPVFGFKMGIIHSIFHSISAFCNAGFDIFGNSLMTYSSNWYVNIIVMILVFTGGLGFIVYLDLMQTRNIRKLKTHTKLVLTISSVLVLVGAFVIVSLEWNNEHTMGNLPLNEKILTALFQSVVARTAGFNTINISSVRRATAFFIIILMFIGGSPASTAGGLKTTTFGIILFATISSLRGKDETVVFKRTIPKYTVMAALTIATLSLLLVIGVTLSLTIIEDSNFNFLNILYEAVSAFGTVGTSRGITSDLSSLSKIIIAITMFIGRVGPTTLAVGIMRDRVSNIKYAEGKVLVG